jgi:hypothetical protein
MLVVGYYLQGRCLFVKVVVSTRQKEDGCCCVVSPFIFWRAKGSARLGLLTLLTLLMSAKPGDESATACWSRLVSRRSKNAPTVLHLTFCRVFSSCHHDVDPIL